MKLQHLAPILPLLAAACSESQHLPGPGGGPNELSVIRGGDPQPIDTLDIRASTSSTTITLFISGGHDPHENVADDGESHQLTIELDRAELARELGSFALTVDGSTRFTFQNVLPTVVVEHRRGAGESAAIRAISLAHYRGNARPQPGMAEQTLGGKIDVSAYEADKLISGHARVIVEGQIPVLFGAGRAELELDFDVAL